MGKDEALNLHSVFLKQLLECSTSNSIGLYGLIEHDCMELRLHEIISDGSRKYQATHELFAG